MYQKIALSTGSANRRLSCKPAGTTAPSPHNWEIMKMTLIILRALLTVLVLLPSAVEVKAFSFDSMNWSGISCKTLKQYYQVHSKKWLCKQCLLHTLDQSQSYFYKFQNEVLYHSDYCSKRDKVSIYVYWHYNLDFGIQLDQMHTNQLDIPTELF